MHANASRYAHKERHWGGFKHCSRRFGVFAQFDFLRNDGACGIDIVSVKIRCVVLSFLNDLVAANGCIVPFASSRYLGYADKLVTLIKIGPLLFEIDFDRRWTCNAVAIPIGDWIVTGSRLGRVRLRSACRGYVCSIRICQPGFFALATPCKKKCCQNYKEPSSTHTPEIRAE